jgi:septum site-determining protein MinD
MIQDKRLPELYLIPAAQTRDKSAVSPSDMVRLCDDLRQEVDCPAGIERGFRNAIAPADIVVVVTNPDVSAVRDADRIIGLIEAEEKGPARLVINRLNLDLIKQGNMLTSEEVLELLAVELVGIVPEDESVVVSTNRGQPVALDPKSRAGQAFQNIDRRLKGEKVEFLNLEEKDGFIRKLARIFRPGGN